MQPIAHPHYDIIIATTERVAHDPHALGYYDYAAVIDGSTYPWRIWVRPGDYCPISSDYDARRISPSMEG